MENYLIIGFIAVLVAVGLFYTVKHFKGSGSCCGGGSYRPKRKKLSGIRYQKTFKGGGMHCEHCRIRVEESVDDIPAVAGKVDLKKGELTVFYAEDVDDELIRKKVERLGYSFAP